MYIVLYDEEIFLVAYGSSCEIFVITVALGYRSGRTHFSLQPYFISLYNDMWG